MNSSVTTGLDSPNSAPAAPAGDTRLALVSLSLSMLIAAVGTGIVNVALPTLTEAFGATFDTAQWIVLAYLLSMTACMAAVGRLGDMMDRRRLLMGGIVLYMLASALCAIAPSIEWLLAARAAQGLGAAIMMSMTMALVGAAVPKARAGAAMGLLATMSAAGTTLGPTLGGFMVSAFGWPSIFLVNLPLGIAALALIARSVPAEAPANRFDPRQFDTVGTLLLAAVLVAYALAMTGAGGSALVNAALVGAAMAGGLIFTRFERKAAHPLIRPGLFRNPVLSAGLVMNCLVSAIMMASLVVGPFHLAHGLGLDTASVGIVMSAGPLMVALAGVPAGRVADRFGVSRSQIGGLSLMTAGALALAMAPASLGVPGYIGPLMAVTLGYAFFHTANNTIVMQDAAADQRGMTSALLNLSRSLGFITGAAVLGSVFAAGGLQTTFLVATFFAALATVVAVRKPA
ncbi:MFS transporter [Pseudokordiimonas caeni]|uniref:MFS transporter n=1 Tax=Pseudokordiimonas caeni TaxID=2997908 RepID=UPI0028112500|nr:MFS transporter [Pseudokordiimonas caeni]